MANRIFILGEMQPFTELPSLFECRQIKGISKESTRNLILENANGLVTDNLPTHKELELLDNGLGQSFQPTGFPVFANASSCEIHPPMADTPWIELIPSTDKYQIKKKVQDYNQKKESTHRWLAWGTLMMVAVLFYLGLKGAGLWLPWYSLELRVAKFLEQDDPRVEVRLAGSLDDLNTRKKELESLAKGVELALLPADLNYVLASRKQECEKYILLFGELTSQPSHQSFTQAGELEVFVKSWQSLGARFPKSWQNTSAYLYWQNRLKDAEEYQSAFLRFSSAYERRRGQFRIFCTLEGLPSEKDASLETWLGAQKMILMEPWCNEEPFLSQSRLSVVLEMRLFIHQKQKEMLHFLDWVKYFHKLQSTKSLLQSPKFSAQIWARFSGEQQAFLKVLAQPLLTKLPELKKTEKEATAQLELFRKLLLD